MLQRPAFRICQRASIVVFWDDRHLPCHDGGGKSARKITPHTFPVSKAFAKLRPESCYQTVQPLYESADSARWEQGGCRGESSLCFCGRLSRRCHPDPRQPF